ncbi:MAG: hypothetical protein K2W99_07795 [Chthoniobacterales bacterium]|nr:hypothetical protein [Chthoniobacterales bacterium]
MGRNIGQNDESANYFPDCKRISEEAKKYRIIMSRVLTQAGFANLTTEYWHWSYGNRYWVCYFGKSAAIL